MSVNCGGNKWVCHSVVIYHKCGKFPYEEENWLKTQPAFDGNS